MIDKINNAFPDCIQNNCLSIVNHAAFKVFDRESACCFTCIAPFPNSLCFFTVENNTAKPLNFLAIDRCLIIDDDNKKCDCAVFNDNEFHFVEIKTASTGVRGKRRRTAFEQLKNTIDVFYGKMDFSGLNVFAMICIGCANVRPRTTSSQIARAVELSNTYGIKLVEGNIIPFN